MPVWRTYLTHIALIRSQCGSVQEVDAHFNRAFAPYRTGAEGPDVGISLNAFAFFVLLATTANPNTLSGAR